LYLSASNEHLVPNHIVAGRQGGGREITRDNEFNSETRKSRFGD
jgi:hypothetical protein